MKKLYIIGFIASFMAAGLTAQQLPNRSMYEDIGFIWNPAETGKWDFWEVSLNYGQDWSNYENAPVVSSVAFQMPINSYRYSKTSVGLFIQNDSRGPINTSNLLASYAYKFKPGISGNNDRLSIGIQVGLAQSRFDNSNLIAFDGVAPDSRLANVQRVSYLPNLGIGAYYRNVPEYDQQYNHYFIGLSTNQLIPISIINPDYNGIAPSFHSNLFLGHRKQIDQFDSFVEPTLQLILLPQNINIIHGRLGLKYETYEKWWIQGMVGSAFEFSAGGGYIFDEKGVLAPVLNGGSLRIGGAFNYFGNSIQAETLPGFELYLGYTYSNF